MILHDDREVIKPHANTIEGRRDKSDYQQTPNQANQDAPKFWKTTQCKLIVQDIKCPTQVVTEITPNNHTQPRYIETKYHKRHQQIGVPVHQPRITEK
jgi:hypothetical protein